MKNQNLAKILYEMGYFLEMEEMPFKPRAYQKVAIIIDALERDIDEMYKKGGRKALEEIPGIGKNISEKIEEYLQTGKIKYYEELKKEMPVKIGELTAVEGIGPKTIKALYEHLRVRDLKDLERVAKQGKIKSLPGFKEKTEQNILQGIAFLKKSKGRFLLGDIFPFVKEVVERLESLKEVEQISIAGSLRRMKETIGDADILVVSKKPKKVMDFFISMPSVVKVWSKGLTRSSVRVEQSFDIDLRVVNGKSYGSALQYFTGSKDHNIAIRKIAIEKGLKLNEYGLFRGSKIIGGRTEEKIYKSLGMDWVEPEMREDNGEIRLAIEKNIPKIIGYNDIQGDLHCHSDWDGGESSIEEMAETARKMGYKYLGISDHTKFLKIENGLDEKQLFKQGKQIDKFNKKFENTGVDFKILKSAETNILNDGSIDIKDEALKKLDYVIAGTHSNLKMSKQKMTERIIRAMKNPYIKIISHPTGRILKKREAYECDLEKILRAAKEFRVVLEINAQPSRLDLNDKNIRRCKEEGVKMIINSDAHHKNQLTVMEFGIAQARRGWAEKKDIINTKSRKQLLEFFK